MKTNRPIKDEISRAFENPGFIINVTRNYSNILEDLFNNDPRWIAVRRQSIERGNTFMEAPLIASSCFMHAMDLYNVPYTNSVETLYSSGSVIKDGDFIVNDKIYQVKSSYRYCSNQQSERTDGVNIHHYIGSMCVKMPESEQDLAYRITYYGVIDGKDLKFKNSKMGYKGKIAQMWPENFKEFPDEFENLKQRYSVVI